MQPSRHRLHPASTAAAAAADKRQLAHERRVSLQQGSRLRHAAEDATAGEGGEMGITHPSLAPRHESPAAPGTRLPAAATGVIDLTADGGSASPSTSTSSDCMILGATAAPQDLASRSAAHTLDWAQPGPSCLSEVPVEPSRGTCHARATETGMAEEVPQSSDAAVQLPRGEDQLADIGLGTASARAAAEPWQSPNLAAQVHGSDDRLAHLREGSARLGGSSLGASRELSAQPALLSAGAQAASTHRRRSRWDVMPDSMSTDIPEAQPPLPSNTPHDLPVHSRGFTAAQSVLSLPELIQAESQSLHRQQPIDELGEVSADSRPEPNHAATQEELQDACRNPDRGQQREKRSLSGRKHSRRSNYRSSRHSSRHSRHRSRSRNSHRSERHAKQSRHRHSDYADRHCVAGSDSRHTRHVSGTHHMSGAQIGSQRNTRPDSHDSMQAAMPTIHGERWEMWKATDV